MTEQRVTDYVVVYGVQMNLPGAPIPSDDLAMKVKRLIEQGWQPQGGVAVDGRALVQAMVYFG